MGIHNLYGKTKIVCTLGPASSTVDVIEKMIRAGMDVVRLNFSHGTHEEHRAAMKAVREAAEQAARADYHPPGLARAEDQNGEARLSRSAARGRCEIHHHDSMKLQGTQSGFPPRTKICPRT